MDFPDTMDNRAILRAFILEKFDALTQLVSELDDATANADLGIAGSNSPIQLLVHCCGMVGYWTSTVNLDKPVPRDRASEFTAAMPVAQAVEIAGHVREKLVDDLARTVPTAPPLAMPQPPEEFWQTTCGGVLLHVLEELAQHLGHLEITVDVLRGPARL